MVEFKVEPSIHGIPTLFLRSECTCQHVTSWVIVICLYKGAIAITLVALSILNRRIKRKDFRHTRKINILIYGIMMMVGVGMPLYFLLNHISIYIGYIILSTILLSTVFLSILTLFLPPVLPALKVKVKGEDKTKKRSSLMTGKSVTLKTHHSLKHVFTPRRTNSVPAQPCSAYANNRMYQQHHL